ncbi:MAG: phospholipase D-like domain-containing protein [Actinomycetota bacterium]|nr:phospholipase D-like domain-containing protein [Actinomycetota bacterium]
MIKKIVVSTVSMLVAGILWAPAAAAVADGPIFNNPKGGTAAKFRLQTHVERAVRATPRGATVLISTYLMDRRQSADALINARNRGVRVQVVLDNDIDTVQSRRLQRVLNRDNGNGGQLWGPDDSFAIQCVGSCRGGGVEKNMHSKFYAFSRTGTSSNVVMVSSANLNRGGATLGWNDLFTMTGVSGMFAKYRQIHEEMARDRVDGDPYVVYRQGRFESQFFPKQNASRATDPTYQALSRVRCRGANGGAGRAGRTAINISMFYWGGERGLYLANRLLELNREGCIVSVIYGAPTNELAAKLRASAWNGGINLYDSRVDRNHNGVVDLRVHTKYMLINGNYGGDSSSWQVFTGSQNWVQGSLTGGDEVTLQVTSRPAYVRYMKNWNYVREHGARKIGR